MRSSFEPSQVRGLLIDLDGVVYTGHQAIPGAAGFLAAARQRGFPFLLVTNNSTTAPEQVAERLVGVHIDVRPEEILTSAEAAMAHVRSSSPDAARVLVVGEAGLRRAAARHGLEVVEDGEADWVVAGLDRTFDYEKLTRATRAIRAGARFLASNTDALLPVEGGAVLPGAGSIVAAIRAATGVEPVVVGKPEPALFQHGLGKLGGLKPSEAAMVGDRLDTDIDGARAAGLRTILVLSGMTTRGLLATTTLQPDAVVADLGEVAHLLGWQS
jgi:4-nitrophenyl phosphatase